ncbi:MAG: iron chelate uptake ABC transporter family permease subunit, partial [Finegoldia magna]|nr:iron chelate uptake ABC transporter family permease subunit [Finegoldia magna]
MVAVVRGYYRRARWKRWAIVLLSVIAVAAFLVTIVVGPVDITLPQLLRALVNPSTVDAQTRMVLWQLRIPSSVMAVLIGVCLSLAGAHMQTILDNPLAEPFTLGISAAAAFGAAASIVLGWTIIPNSQFNVAVCAAVASLVAVAIVAAVSRRREDGRESMILLGIALVFGFHALLALLQYRATPEALQQIVFWTMGSLQRATWTSNAIIAAVLAIA